MHEIDQMTDFADDSSAALARIVHPMTARKPAGVYAISDGKRRTAAFEKILCPLRQRRKPAIETHHQTTRRVCRRGQHGVQFRIVKGQRFFYEYIASAFESSLHE